MQISTRASEQNGDIWERKTLCVENLAYRPLPDAFENIENYLVSKIPLKWQKQLGVEQPQNENTKVLHDVSFEAKAGKITGIIGGEVATRRTLVDLICGERWYGSFSGDIYMTDNSGEEGRVKPSFSATGTYYDNIAYIKGKTLYLAGLTYLDMVTYSSRIRCKSACRSNR